MQENGICKTDKYSKRLSLYSSTSPVFLLQSALAAVIATALLRAAASCGRTAWLAVGTSGYT